MTNKKPIRILLVDDHPCVLSGLRAYLRTKTEFRVVGHAMSGEEGIQKNRRLKPDVVVMDLSLPGMSGCSAMHLIRRDDPGTRIVAYTMHDAANVVQEAIIAGASGYVHKSSPVRTLVRAIHTVHNGNCYFDLHVSRSVSILSSANLAYLMQREPALSQRSANGAHSSSLTMRDPFRLTPTEREVLRLIAEGLVIKEVGELLGISYHTAHTHVKNIYHKLGVHTRGGAVRRALQDPLIYS